MTVIRQSTARTILVGPVLDSAGTAKTDEVVASIKVTKNGTVGAANGSATLTHDHTGKYLLALTASDTDTVGVLEISLNSGTNDMPVARFNVVEEAVFDALFAASTTTFDASGNIRAVDDNGDELATAAAVASLVLYIDTEVAAILEDTGTTLPGLIAALPQNKTGYSLAAAGLDAVLVESSIVAGVGLTDDAGTQLTSINARQALALAISALNAVLAGAGTTAVTIKPAGKPSGNTRVSATVDADGNRTAVILKVPT